jgi:hypothetical protein
VRETNGSIWPNAVGRYLAYEQKRLDGLDGGAHVGMVGIACHPDLVRTVRPNPDLWRTSSRPGVSVDSHWTEVVKVATAVRAPAPPLGRVTMNWRLAELEPRH